MTSSDNPSRPWRRALLGATAVGLVTLSPVACAAPSCSFNSASGVNFGAYDVFAAAPNNNGVASLTIHCQNGGGPTFVVTLSAGQSNSYLARTMKSGGNMLNYNLFTSAARSIVWGDGSGGSDTVRVGRNADTMLSVFGQIPAGQDAAAGTYADNIVVTVNF